MSARERILRDIRTNLNRPAVTTAPTPPPVRLHIPEVNLETRVARMMDRVTALAGHAFRAQSKQEAAEYIAVVTRGRTAVSSDEPFSRERCATAEVGITGADYALSDTGTLVMLTGSRLISLLPPVHIAVVTDDRLLSGLDEFYTLIPKPADHFASTVFITGPSRTADIEQILVRGVHGPGELHVVLCPA